MTPSPKTSSDGITVASSTVYIHGGGVSGASSKAFVVVAAPIVSSPYGVEPESVTPLMSISMLKMRSSGDSAEGIDFSSSEAFIIVSPSTRAKAESFGVFSIEGGIYHPSGGVFRCVIVVFSRKASSFSWNVSEETLSSLEGMSSVAASADVASSAKIFARSEAVGSKVIVATLWFLASNDER